jgi:hypothetical protein
VGPGELYHSKLITNADNTENVFNPVYFSPFERVRIRSLAIEDVPQALNIAASYDLPFGRGKRWLNQGALNAVLATGRSTEYFAPNPGSIPDFPLPLQCAIPVC